MSGVADRSVWQATPIALGIAMVATALGVQWLQPEALIVDSRESLAQSVPTQFGDWKEVSFGADQIDPGKGATDEPDMDRPYDDVLMRAYGNSHGDVVLLAVAYGRNQRQEVNHASPLNTGNELDRLSTRSNTVGHASTT